MPHLDDDLIRRFTALDATPAENRNAVLHLLRGCPECAERMCRLWWPPVEAEAYDGLLAQNWGERLRRNPPATARPRRASRNRRGIGRYPHFAKKHPETKVWLLAGLGLRSASALVAAGYRVVADLDRETRERLLAIPGFGVDALMALERFLGRTLPARKPMQRRRPRMAAKQWRKS